MESTESNISCLLEEGYLVCVHKNAFSSVRARLALLADSALLHKDVGKLSFLHGLTVPKDFPSDPHFITEDDESHVIAPGAWIQQCPVLVGGQHLHTANTELCKRGKDDVYGRQTLQKIEDTVTATFQELKPHATKSSQAAMKCLDGMTGVCSVTDDEKNALLGLFAHTMGDSAKEDHVIYMVNTIHGAASCALGEVVVAPEKIFEAPILEILDHDVPCTATFLPYYSADATIFKEGVKLSHMMKDTKGECLDELVPSNTTEMPKCTLMEETTRSDVLKLFPYCVTPAENGDWKKLLKMYRSVILNVPGGMSQELFGVVPPNSRPETVKSFVDIGCASTLGALYTGRSNMATDISLEPRVIHINNVLEEFDKMVNMADTDDTLEVAHKAQSLADDINRTAIMSLMDPCAAINMLGYEVEGSCESDIVEHFKRVYIKPSHTVEGGNPLVRLLCALQGDVVTCAGIVSWMERDVFKSETMGKGVSDLNDRSYGKNCQCVNYCVHQLISTWCMRSHLQGCLAKQGQKRSSVSAMGKKTTTAKSDKQKGRKKAPHTGGFLGTVRAQQYRVFCSPFGTTSFKWNKRGTSETTQGETSAPPAAAPSTSENTPKHDQSSSNTSTASTNSRTNGENMKNAADIANQLAASCSFGVEGDDETIMSDCLGISSRAMSSVMRTWDNDSLHKVLLKDCDGYVQHGKNESVQWVPGKKKGISLERETATVSKRAAKHFFSMLLDKMAEMSRTCREMKREMNNAHFENGMWKTRMCVYTNMCQYDHLTAALFVATFLNGVRPLVHSLKHTGKGFQEIKKRSFPSLDRTKLNDIFSKNGPVKYGMSGTFVQVPDSLVCVSRSGNTKTEHSVKWLANQGLALDMVACNVDGIAKGKDTSAENAAETAADGVAKEQEGAGGNTKLKAFLETMLPFEDPTEMKSPNYTGWLSANVEECEGTVPVSPLSDYLRYRVSIELFMNSKKKKGNLVDISKIRDAVKKEPVTKYCCDLLDRMMHAYVPSRPLAVANGGLLNSSGLPLVKKILSLVSVCRVFCAPVNDNKPAFSIFSTPRVVVPRQRAILHKCHNVVDYDMLLCASDAPVCSMWMDYTVYGSSYNADGFGGMITKKPYQFTSSVISMLRAETALTLNLGKEVPAFILRKPGVPFMAGERVVAEAPAFETMEFFALMTVLQNDVMMCSFVKDLDVTEVGFSPENIDAVAKKMEHFLYLDEDQRQCIAQYLLSMKCQGGGDAGECEETESEVLSEDDGDEEEEEGVLKAKRARTLEEDIEATYT